MKPPPSVLTPDTSERWLDFFRNYRCIAMYTVDPGACALAELFRPMLRALNIYGGWYAEGWTAKRHPDLKSVSRLLANLGQGMTLLLGPQIKYARTHEMLETARACKAGSIFVFDHWKNYAESFRADLLPDTIVVPDSHGRRALLSAIGEQHANRVVELPHVAVEIGRAHV